MTRARLFAAALAAVLLAAPASAAKDQFDAKTPVVVDPARSYIFFRARKAPVRFLREVDAQERAAYDQERAAAYEKAYAKYTKKLAQWRKSEAQWRDSEPTARHRIERLPRPVALTPETFDYPPPEADNWLMVKGGTRFSEGEEGSSYLIAVEPGTYILYGQITDTENGPIGTCLCMGSVKFAAPAGKIVDIGEIEYPRVEAAKADLEGKVRSRPSHRLVPPDAAQPRPARLAGLPVVPADLRAANKLPNYFGIEIDRLPAVAGVLAYERDRVVDVKGGPGEGGRP
ncbi:MAG TPA: hypothetical protein VF718_06635 [Allosphingosinicella sp.]|jgi:hypothetical protein